MPWRKLLQRTDQGKNRADAGRIRLGRLASMAFLPARPQGSISCSFGQVHMLAIMVTVLFTAGGRLYYFPELLSQ